MSLKSEKKSVLRVITANKLTDGVVVYFTGSKWSENIQLSFVCADENYLVEEATRTIELENLISVELIKVELQGSVICPLSIREKIRSLGPTIKYSEIDQLTRRDHNVSI